MSAPDPSAPSALDAQIRQVVMNVLNDPLSYPPGITNWLAQFVAINTPKPPPPPPSLPGG